jgi:hypothetical protein
MLQSYGQDPRNSSTNCRISNAYVQIFIDRSSKSCCKPYAHNVDNVSCRAGPRTSTRRPRRSYKSSLKPSRKDFRYQDGYELNVEGQKAEIFVETWDRRMKSSIVLELSAKHPEQASRSSGSGNHQLSSPTASRIRYTSAITATMRQIGPTASVLSVTYLYHLTLKIAPFTLKTILAPLILVTYPTASASLESTAKSISIM